MIAAQKPARPAASRAFSIAAWLLLGAAVLLTVWTASSGGIFKPDFWTPTGLRRLKLLALWYTAWSAGWLRLAPRWFAPATLAGAMLAAAVAVGPLSVAAVLLFLYSSLLLGTIVLNPPAPKLLRLMLGAAIWMTVVWVAVHFPINYPLVYLLALAAPAALRPRAARACLGEALVLFRPLDPGSHARYVFLAVAGFPLLCHLVVALKPEMGADALATHLTIPAWVGFQHLWPFDFRHISWALMPVGSDWCYTAVYLLGGEFAARLLNFAFLAVLAGLLYGVSRRHGSALPALLAAGLFASTPLVELVTGSLMVENFWAGLLFAAVVSLDLLHATGDRRYLYALAVFLGAAMATKLGSITFVVPMSLFLAWELLRPASALANRGRSAALAFALFLLFAAPPYAFAYAQTGNPVFPYLNTYFKSPFFQTTHPVVDYRWLTPLTPATPYQIVFQTHRFLEGRDGALGLHYLVLLAIALAAAGAGWPYFAWLALVTAAGGFFLTFRTVSYVRYLYPALPMLLGFSAVALSRLERGRRPLYRAACAALLAALLVNVYLLPSSNWYHGDFWLNPFNKQAVQEYHRFYAPPRALTAWLNEHHPGVPVAFFDTDDIAGFHGRAYCLSWHNQNYSDRVSQVRNAAGYATLATELGLRYFIARRDRRPEFRPVADFLDRYTEPEFSNGRFEIRRIRRGRPVLVPAPARTGPAAAPCEPGFVDDASSTVRYTGPWQAIENYGEACGGTLTFTNEVDATIEFPFTGTAITYFFTRAHNRGQAEISIDGARRAQLDPYAPRIEWRSRLTFGGLARGPHTFTLRVLHTKRPASEGYDIDLDGFLVTP